MAAYWPTATDEEGEKIKTYMNGIAKIAVSRSMTTADWNNTCVVRTRLGTQEAEGRNR